MVKKIIFIFTVLFLFILSSCNFPNMPINQVKQICPVKIDSLTWGRPAFYDYIYASLRNTSNKTIDRVVIEVEMQYDDRPSVGDLWINVSEELIYDLGMRSNSALSVEWITDYTDTLKIDVANSYIGEIDFSDGTTWQSTDYTWM